MAEEPFTHRLNVNYEQTLSINTHLACILTRCGKSKLAPNAAAFFLASGYTVRPQCLTLTLGSTCCTWTSLNAFRLNDVAMELRTLTVFCVSASSRRFTCSRRRLKYKTTSFDTNNKYIFTHSNYIFRIVRDIVHT